MNGRWYVAIFYAATGGGQNAREIIREGDVVDYARRGGRGVATARVLGAGSVLVVQRAQGHAVIAWGTVRVVWRRRTEARRRRLDELLSRLGGGA